MSKTVAGNPYPGSRAFQQADHDHFFGRIADASAIAELWQDNRLTVVSGRLASGKTSLIRAGVYPLMTGNRRDVLPPGRLSCDATFPFAALPEHNSYTLALLRSWSPEEMAPRLAGQSVADFVGRRIQQSAGIVYAAIDQVEELLTDAGSGTRRMWRRWFLADLAQAMRDEPRLHLLLIARGEALDLISTAVGIGARYAVAPLTRQGAIEAVTGPVRGTGRSFAEGAAEKLVADLRASRFAPADGERGTSGDFVEPALLQAVCTRLWQSLPADVSVITERDVRAFGDADTALAEHCSDVISAVAAEHDETSGRVRSWLLGSFVAAGGSRRAVDEGAVETAGMPNAVARALADRHVLATEPKSGLRTYRLLSDRLIEPLRRAADKLPPPSTPVFFLGAAERALTQGELDLAGNNAMEALRAEPDFRLRAQAHSLLGNLAFEQDKPAEAQAHYREAASLLEAAADTPASARQLAAAGQMLLAQGQTAEAVDELRSAADRMPHDLVIQTELALALWQFGEGQAAVALLNGVLAVDGGNMEALRARGEILADLGDGRHAILDLDRQTLRDRPSILAARGLALAELGDHPAASKEIDSAVAKAPRSGLVLLYAARVTALGGDKISSAELARRAVDATDPPLSGQHREAAERLAGRKLTARTFGPARRP